MKKFFLFLLFFILGSINSPCLVGNFISSKKNINQHHVNDVNKLGDFKKTNSVSITEYGVKREDPDKDRRLRLNIFMTNYIYVYFMDMFKKDSQDFFINSFLLKPPFLHREEWGNVQKNLKRGFYIQSETHGQDPDFFENLFLQHLKDPLGYSDFKNVFLGINLKWNTYFMPKGYGTAQAEKQFRREGVIFQFYFIPHQFDGHETWIVSDVCSIFPYQRQVMSLKQYYKISVLKEGEIQLLPPIIGIKRPRSAYRVRRVGDLLTEISETLKYCFNAYTEEEFEISILNNQKKKVLSLGVPNGKPITLGFFYINQQGKEQLYACHDVILYLLT